MQTLKEEDFRMKINWRRLAALLLAAILMLSLSGMGENEISIENNISSNTAKIEGDHNIEGGFTESDVLLDDSLELNLSSDTLNSLEESIIGQPTIAELEIIEPEEGNASNSITLGVKETYQLSKKGLGNKLSFKSSKPKVVSVTDKGIVKGLKKGNAVVTVKSGNKEKARFTIKVVAAPKKVTLPFKSTTIGVKESITLEPTITNGSHTSYTWTVKDTKIATVSKEGVVKGVKAGTTTISVKTHNGKTASLKLTVKPAPKKVSLGISEATLGAGETLQLKPEISKGSATTLTYTSKNKKVATVSDTGLIKAVKNGTTTITVKTHNGKKATVKATVKAAPKKVTLNKTKLKMSLFDEIQLKATLPTGSASNKLIWTSSDENVVTVFEDGRLFAEDVGTAPSRSRPLMGRKPHVR